LERRRGIEPRTPRLQLGRSPLAVAAHGTPGVIRTPNGGFGIRLPHHRQLGQNFGAPGRIRTSIRPVLSGLPLPVGLRAHGRLGRIRTDTGHGLSVLPLPTLGYEPVVFGARFELATMRFSTARVFFFTRTTHTRRLCARKLRHPNIGGQSRIRTSAIPMGYRVYSPALSASQPTAQTNCQRSGGRQATRTPMSRGTWFY
jgi:hypothetical protein